MLYEISKNGHTATILGTFHADIALEQLPYVVQQRLAAAQTVVTETDMRLAEAAMEKIMSQGNPATLQSAVTPQEWNKILYTLTPMGIPRGAIAALYPGQVLGLYLQVKTGPGPSPSMDFLDNYLVQYGKTNGKELAFLELPEAQLLAFQNVSKDVGPLKQVLAFSSQQELRDYLLQRRQAQEKMVDFYLDGDEEALHVHLEASSTTTELKEIFNDRNVSWIPEINRLIEKEGTEFIAFGAGHLGGSQGVLELLRHDGFQVKRIDLPVATTEPGLVHKVSQ